MDAINNFFFSKPDSSVNAFKAFQGPKRLGRLGLNAAPLVIPAGVFAAWLVWPALTPQFKSDMGIGPKIED